MIILLICVAAYAALATIVSWMALGTVAALMEEKEKLKRKLAREKRRDVWSLMAPRNN